jgi:hypothetical protein
MIFHLMTKLLKLAGKVMRTAAGLHRNRARRKLGHELDQRSAAQGALELWPAQFIKTMQLKDSFAKSMPNNVMLAIGSFLDV